MTKYKFNVNSQTLEGDLTWNTLGTLEQLGITDPFNSSDNNQTCAYTHDDLARVATDVCAGGVSWSQAFTYDPFGNITKSGSGPFAPSYTSSPPTNQITMVGSTAASYDANGNVLTDTEQNYTWDADGHPISIGNVNQSSVGAAYDALGDVVEQNRSGAYTQVVYAPDGTKLALMNGTGTMVKAFVPLTGGATAIYNSSGLAYYRHSDWLGNSRLTSTPSRTVYADAAYAPFGETYAQSGTPDDPSRE
jgi:YD repeat-containing protein